MSTSFADPCPGCIKIEEKRDAGEKRKDMRWLLLRLPWHVHVSPVKIKETVRGGVAKSKKTKEKRKEKRPESDTKY
jgi:hypothetical protein